MKTGTRLEELTTTRVALPAWVPKHIPELDGLRGLAVLGVFLHHCLPRLGGTPLFAIASWGWAGVNLFFVLSGYLITAILLRSREHPAGYFRNFYGRRSLRVWPLYVVVLVVYWLVLRDPLLPGVPHSVVFVALCLFVQNLFPMPLTGALQPTWSLAIEEQFYWVWAPLVRFTGSPRKLAAGMFAVLMLSPVARATIGHRLNSQHTLLHLDAIAVGSLLAIGILGSRVTRESWLRIGGTAIGVGLLALVVGQHFGAGALQDSWIALGFGGLVLLSLAGSGARNPVAGATRRGPLPWLGQISYGFYLTHMPVIVLIGAFDAYVDHSALAGVRGNLLIVAVRFLACLLVATLSWYGFEKPLLRLKRFFPQ